MNEYMKNVQDKAENDWFESEITGQGDFQGGFEACHDILMPLLEEALRSVMKDFTGRDGGLVERIKKVTE